VAIELVCTCGRRFETAEETRGTLVRCPDCGTAIFVPSPGEPNGGLLSLDAAPAGPGEAQQALADADIVALREERPDRPAAEPATPRKTDGAGPPPAEALERTPEQLAETLPGAPLPPEKDAEVVEGPAGSGILDQGFAVRADEGPAAEARRYERCPQCDAPLEPEAIVCTACGLNLVTGERPRRVKVEGPPPAAAEVSLGVLAYVATWMVRLRHVILAAAVIAAGVIVVLDWVAGQRRKLEYMAEGSEGGIVRWWEAARKAVEQEAYDLERRTQQQVQMAMMKLQAEPEAERGVFCRESIVAAQDAYLEAREARIERHDPASAERLLTAIDVLYGPMDPWGARAREELARARGGTTKSAPATRGRE
jgi:DNA-directed RNA polymerase subunit RPC12/RpoP